MANIQIGVRAHDLNFVTPEELCDHVHSFGLDTIQLAIQKAFPMYAATLPEVTLPTVKTLASTLLANDLHTGILGCYIDLSAPVATRQPLLNAFQLHLHAATDLQAPIVASEMGRVYPEFSGADGANVAYQRVSSALAALLPIAEAEHVTIGIEGGRNNPASRWLAQRQLIDDLQSDALKVVFDPINFLQSPVNATAQLQMALDALHEHIVAIHLKDFINDHGKIHTVPFGQGELDFSPLWDFVKHCDRPLLLSLESTNETAIPDSLAKLSIALD